MALGLDDVRVGVWTSPDGVSGCTVVLPPPGTLGAVAVRGAAPGTREAAALGPQGHVVRCDAVVLSGGSAYGLASADGVMGWLEERGIGYPVAGHVVPIVGAAILLDGSVSAPSQRPGAAAGRHACDQASAGEPAEGRVGAGAGCTVAKVAGLEHRRPGGQAIAVRRAGGITVGAIVANNALGEIVGDDGALIAAADVADDVPRYPVAPLARPATPADSAPGGGTGRTRSPDGPPTNTVIGCVVTDARLDKAQGYRVADLAHSGIARAVRPAHTDMDGDAIFCLATGQAEASVDLVAHLAAEVVAEATRRAAMPQVTS